MEMGRCSVWDLLFEDKMHYTPKAHTFTICQREAT
jgi:hypothetical protein